METFKSGDKVVCTFDSSKEIMTIKYFWFNGTTEHKNEILRTSINGNTLVEFTNKGYAKLKEIEHIKN